MVLYGLQVCSEVELDAPIKFLFKAEWSIIEINDGAYRNQGWESWRELKVITWLQKREYMRTGIKRLLQ